MYGDNAYQGSRPGAAIRARGGTPRIVHAGIWGGTEALARLDCKTFPCGGCDADRIGVWDHQAQLRSAPAVLARPGQGRFAGQAGDDGLQPAPELATSGVGCSVH